MSGDISDKLAGLCVVDLGARGNEDNEIFATLSVTSITSPWFARFGVPRGSESEIEESLPVLVSLEIY